ncbi:MAG: DUF2723 domain-containing protein [Deltaproteobacteria bacterium]|nr:MAG: DUF2723 domain-containing protein [Deltaproteobacteria bacterium]
MRAGSIAGPAGEAGEPGAIACALEASRSIQLGSPGARGGPHAQTATTTAATRPRSACISDTAAECSSRRAAIERAAAVDASTSVTAGAPRRAERTRGCGLHSSLWQSSIDVNERHRGRARDEPPRRAQFRSAPTRRTRNGEARARSPSAVEPARGLFEHGEGSSEPSDRGCAICRTRRGGARTSPATAGVGSAEPSRRGRDEPRDRGYAICRTRRGRDEPSSRGCALRRTHDRAPRSMHLASWNRPADEREWRMAGALRRFLFERGGLVALVAFAAYVWIAPPHIVDGDNAEMATLGMIGGVAHPTGYPAYLLWLRATSWLPGSTPAHTAAIATAILAAVQLVVLHAACRAWGARPIAASAAVAIYAAGPVVMRYSSEAEVFALNQLVVAAIVYLAAAGGPLRGVWRVAALGLVAGLGIADHVTCVLAAPVGLVGAVRGVREARRGAVAAAAGVAALAAGLAPYAYLLVTPENAISWTPIAGLDGLVGQLHVAANLAGLAATLGRTWWWLPALAGVAMLAVRCVRAGEGEPRIGWQMLALAFVAAGPVLAARFDVVPVGLDGYAVRRFHLMPALLLAVPVAAALDVVVARYEARIRLGPATAIAALGFAAAALVAAPDVLRVRTPAVEHALRGMLRGLPPGAVAIISGDMTFFGTGYLQLAWGERPDATVVVWHLVGDRGYRDRLARRGIAIEKTTEATPSVGIAEHILASGRPLLVDRALGNVLKALPSYPYGTLFRVLPRGQARPSLDEVAAQNRDWFAALDLDYPRPGPDDEYPTAIHDSYAATWRIVADGFATAGRRDDAASAAAVARELAPRP